MTRRALRMRRRRRACASASDRTSASVLPYEYTERNHQHHWLARVCVRCPVVVGGRHSIHREHIMPFCIHNTPSSHPSVGVTAGVTATCVSRCDSYHIIHHSSCCTSFLHTSCPCWPCCAVVGPAHVGASKPAKIQICLLLPAAAAARVCRRRCEFEIDRSPAALQPRLSHLLTHGQVR